MKRLDKNELVIVDELDQDSEEWLEWRKGGIGSSDVALLMKPEPVFDRTIGTLWKQKIGYERAVAINNPHVRRGKELEPKIRDMVNKSLGMDFNPSCLFRRDAPYLRASLDGIDLGADALLEIKAPAENSFKKMLALFPKIPEHYYFQMQYQMLVSDVEYGIFAFYNDTYPEPFITPVYNNYELQLDIERRSHLFWRAVENRIPIGWKGDQLTLFHTKSTLFVVVADGDTFEQVRDGKFLLPVIDFGNKNSGIFLIKPENEKVFSRILKEFDNHTIKVIPLTDSTFGLAGKVTVETLDDFMASELKQS